MNREDKRNVIEALNERITMVETLKQQEGWKLFQATVLEPLEVQAMTAAMSEKESFQAAKHLGILKVARDLKTWADREIEAARATIQQVETER